MKQRHIISIVLFVLGIVWILLGLLAKVSANAMIGLIVLGVVFLLAGLFFFRRGK